MLKTGEIAPLFEGNDQNGKYISLQELLKNGPLVLYFYPKDESLGCTAQACNLRDSYEDFMDAGASVVGVSPDSGESHKAFALHHRLPFSLISDPDFTIHQLFDAAPGMLPQRATFVIGQDQKIKHSFSSLVRIQKHVKDALRVIQELKAPV